MLKAPEGMETLGEGVATPVAAATSRGETPKGAESQERVNRKVDLRG